MVVKKSVIYPVLGVFLLCLGMAVFSRSACAAADLFTVENVQVDVTADNALMARDEAFAEAQKKAFDALAARMLAEGAMADYTPPEASVISTMVQDFEIVHERLSSVRYIATYTFRFRDAAVRDFFGQRGVSYTDVSSRPLLILPVFEQNSRRVLWAEDNPWMSAWNRVRNFSALVPLEVPIGDLQDVKDIGGDDVLSYSNSRLNDMLARYGAAEAVIAIARPDQSLSNAMQTAEQAAGALSVLIYRTDRAGPEFVQQLDVAARPMESLETLMDRAAGQVQAALQQDWKTKTVIAPQEKNHVLVRVMFDSLEQWAETQRVLSMVYGVSEINLRSLSPRQALVDLYFDGDHQRLRLALAQSEITLATPNALSSGRDQAAYDLYLNRYAPAAAYNTNGL